MELECSAPVNFLIWIMQKQNILRIFLFVIFFSIGAATISLSILSNDLLGYYQNKKLLKEANITLDRLISLNADYDVLLQQLERDPNLVERIAPAILGTEPADPNTVRPKITSEQLNAVRKALTDDSSQQEEKDMPDWLSRSSEPKRRITLFVVGAFLILIALIFFGPAKKIGKEK